MDSTRAAGIPLVASGDGGGSGPARADVALAGLCALCTAVFLTIGPGLYLDDWWALRNVQSEGFWAAAGSDQWAARPVAAFLYSVLFGGVGPHPNAFVLILFVLNAASAIIFRHVLCQFFSDRLATLAAVIWIVMPNHLTVEVWASATNITISQLCILAGTLVLVRGRPSMRALVAAAVLYLVAVLAYEAAGPISLALVAVAAYLPGRRAGRRWTDIDWRVLVAGWGAVALGIAWSLTHVHPLKKVSRSAVDLTPMFSANLGWGPAGFGPLLPLVFAAGLAACGAAIVLLIRRSSRAAAGEGAWAAVVGLAIIPLGAVSFALYTYEPIGGGDRMNYVSAFGGALVFAGGARMLAERARVAAWVAVAVLLGVMGTVRIERYGLWHDAGLDGVTMSRAIVERAHAVGGPITAGPSLVIVDNYGAFEGLGNLEAAVQYTAGDPTLEVILARSPAEFEATPVERRVDLCEHSALCGRKEQG